MKRIVIVGGGTAGWLSALSLDSAFKKRGIPCALTLVESPHVPIIGVGEGTTDNFLHFLHRVEINVHEFIRETEASYKLGIKFSNWAGKQDTYFNPIFGQSLDLDLLVAFAKKWEGPFTDLMLASHLMQQNRSPYDSNDATHAVSFGFHFGAAKVVDYFSRVAASRGVTHLRQEVQRVNVDPESGDLRSIVLTETGELVGDLFVDCTGFTPLLLEKMPGISWRSFLAELPCDRAVVTQKPYTDEKKERVAFTSAVALSSGWRFQIPTLHRMGNGYVYASNFISDEEARKEFLSDLELPESHKTRFIQFRPGYQKSSWQKNVLAVGLSAGFLEPLEATSLWLSISALDRFESLYFADLDDQSKHTAFNRAVCDQYERMKDFLVAHYYYGRRSDTAFWRHMTSGELPGSLLEKVDTVLGFYAEKINDVSRLQEAITPVPFIVWMAVLDGLGVAEQSKSSKKSKLAEQYVRSLQDKAQQHLPLQEMLVRVNNALGLHP